LLFALGIHGQYLFVDRRNQLVIVMMSSQANPLAAELISLTMTAVSHIRETLALSQ
jgi:CubicO group peptidase (beta-lactamase class C family)